MISDGVETVVNGAKVEGVTRGEVDRIDLARGQDPRPGTEIGIRETAATSDLFSATAIHPTEMRARYGTEEETQTVADGQQGRPLLLAVGVRHPSAKGTRCPAVVLRLVAHHHRRSDVGARHPIHTAHTNKNAGDCLDMHLVPQRGTRAREAAAMIAGPSENDRAAHPDAARQGSLETDQVTPVRTVTTRVTGLDAVVDRLLMLVRAALADMSIEGGIHLQLLLVLDDDLHQGTTHYERGMRLQVPKMLEDKDMDAVLGHAMYTPVALVACTWHSPPPQIIIISSSPRWHR